MLVFSFLMVAQVGLAAPTSKSTGLDATAKQGYDLTENQLGTPANSDLPTIIGKIVGAALAFLGVVFFILIIYGGYMWMFSMGNEQTAGKAKEIIIAAVIGLVIVLMAYAITSFLGTTVAPGTPAS